MRAWREHLKVSLMEPMVVTPELSAKNVGGWNGLTNIRLMPSRMPKPEVDGLAGRTTGRWRPAASGSVG